MPWPVSAECSRFGGMPRPPGLECSRFGGVPRPDRAKIVTDTSGRAGSCARLLAFRPERLEVALVHSYLLCFRLDHDVLYSAEHVPDDDRKTDGSHSVWRHGLDSWIIRALPEQDVPHQAERVERR